MKSILFATLASALVLSTVASTVSAQPAGAPAAPASRPALRPAEGQGRGEGAGREARRQARQAAQEANKAVETATKPATDAAASATAATAAVVAPTDGAVAEWIVDPVHSSIVFNIGHNGISRVFGTFSDFSGIIKFSPENLAASSIEVSVKTSSVNTNNSGRDKHIQDGEYLKVETADTATFKSTSITAVDADTYKAAGDLTIAGTTTPVSFEFDITGTMTDQRGATRVGAASTFKIDRTAYSIGKPQGLSPDVELQVSLQAIKQ